MNQKINTNNFPKTGTLLFLGPNLESIALKYAESLLNEKTMRSNELFAANSHPDFYFIKPEEKANWIKIDQIRDLIEWSFGKPQISQKKVAVISPADLLNIQAANALLKTLEEPSIDTVFILVSDRLSAIPLTIRSRCHIVRLSQSENSSLIEIDPELKTLVKTQLDALRQNKTHPVAVSELWAKKDLKTILAIWYEVIYEDIKSNPNNSSLKNKNLWNFIDNLSDMIRSTHRQNPPNAQLALDVLLIEYVNICQDQT